MVLFVVPFYHFSNCNFNHNLIQIFLQFIAGLDKVGLVSIGGTVVVSW